MIWFEMRSDAKCVRRVIERPFTFSAPAVHAAYFLTLFYSRVGLETRGRLLPRVQGRRQWALGRGPLVLSSVSHRLRNTPRMTAQLSP